MYTISLNPFSNFLFGTLLILLFLFCSIQSLSLIWLFVTAWTATCQASLSIINSQSVLKLLSIESVMPSNHLILCHALLFLPSMFPNIRVFSNGSVIHIRWPKYWSFSFNISPSNEYSGMISFRIDWFDLLAIPHLFLLYWKCSLLLFLKPRLYQVYNNICYHKRNLFCSSFKLVKMV